MKQKREKSDWQKKWIKERKHDKNNHKKQQRRRRIMKQAGVTDEDVTEEECGHNIQQNW